MLKLYGGARSRASIVHWYLEELKVPYEFVKLDMQAGEHLKPEYLAINPVGKVPAIVDGDFKLWESGAILPISTLKLHFRQRNVLYFTNGFCLPMLPLGQEFL